MSQASADGGNAGGWLTIRGSTLSSGEARVRHFAMVDFSEWSQQEKGNGLYRYCSLMCVCKNN